VLRNKLTTIAMNNVRE